MVDDAIGVLFNKLSMLILFSDPNLPKTEGEIISWEQNLVNHLMNSPFEPGCCPEVIVACNFDFPDVSSMTRRIFSGFMSV